MPERCVCVSPASVGSQAEGRELAREGAARGLSDEKTGRRSDEPTSNAWPKFQDATRMQSVI